MRAIVVFSDIDGTLIDIFTRNYGESKDLVKKLKEYSIPVILCSSKTRAEQDQIRRDLGLEDEPFIIENGGAVMIPEGYFDSRDNDEKLRYYHESMRSGDGYRIIELGRSSREIRITLHDIRRKTGTSFKGVSDVSIDELANIVGMTHEEAERMSKRKYGETILMIDKTQKAQFEQELTQQGLQVIYGGRYFDVTAGNDKGKAVRILMDLYRKKLGDDTRFIGIGDSLNDIPMLRLTDIAILVQKHDGTWAEVDGIDDFSDVVKVEGIGPVGWENAFAIIMKEAQKSDGT